MEILDSNGRPLDSIPRLIALIEQGIEPSRSEAVAEALERADPRTLPALEAEIRARRLSARHLWKFESAAVPHLIALLRAGQPVVRWHAAEALARTRDVSAEENLTHCTEDQAFVVRWAAAKALETLKGGSPAWKRTRKRLNIGKYLDREWHPENPFCFMCGSRMTAHGEPLIPQGLADFFGGRGEAEATFAEPGSFDGSYCDPCGMLYCERCSRRGSCAFCGEPVSADSISWDQTVRGIAKNTMNRFV